MSKLSQYGDALERTLWTAAEGAGAVGLVAGYQALPLADIPPGYIVLVTIVLGALLAAGKGIIATNVGNGSASLGLPVDIEPVPASSVEATIARATGDDVLLPDAPGQDGTDKLEPPVVDDPDPDADGNGRGDVTGRFKAKHVNLQSPDET